MTERDRLRPGSPREREVSRIRTFYDTIGWVRRDGTLTDTTLFGPRDVGPLRTAARAARRRRIEGALARAGRRPRLVELGCGAKPCIDLLPLCAHYVGVDFSRRGLAEADALLAASGHSYDLVLADVCDLPFADGTFDAAYSAHVLYHLEPSLQQTAFAEILRVLRPQGVAVFVLANPRPWLFPLTLSKRVITDTPVLRDLAFNLRSLIRPAGDPSSWNFLPYHPLTRGTIHRILGRFGKVAIEGYAVASNWFERRVSEHSFLGRQGFRWFGTLERDFPSAAARLGNYVLISVQKRA